MPCNKCECEDCSSGRNALAQVDDMLVSNWIVVENNDYKRALNDLVSFGINIHEYFKSNDNNVG
jgi:hypothetical protein